jgi:acetyltransferase
VRGAAAVASIEQLPGAEDLAILATRADTLPGLVDACGRKGIRAAAVVSAGLTGGAAEDPVHSALAHTARRAGVRLLGPNSLGVVRASLGLHAAFSAARAAPGTLALLTQSGGLASSILDWAGAEGVGSRASSRRATSSTWVSRMPSTTSRSIPRPRAS